MKNTWLIIIIGVVVLTGLYLLFSFSQQNKGYNWSSYYQRDNKDPYNFYLLPELLGTIFPDHKVVIDKQDLTVALSEEKIDKPSIFFYIDHYFGLNSDELDSLFAFIERGNQALIISSEQLLLTDKLIEKFCESTNLYFNESSLGSTITATLAKVLDDSGSPKSYTYTHMYKDQTDEFQWNYFDEEDLDCIDRSFEKLGQIGDYETNFLVIRMGEGKLFLHSNPILFTNYHLRNEEKLEYAEKVFAHLTPADILWLEPAVKPAPFARPESPLQFILSRPPLTWALYILLAAILLFLIFRSKRRQKIIPVEVAPANTSLEFINTISRLYYQQQNHHKLALQSMRIFLNHVRQRYRLDLTNKATGTIELLARKSGYPEKNITLILDQYTYIESRPEIPLDLFLEFHQGIEDFYKMSK